VGPRAIRNTALLTVEGEKHDIRTVGRTLAPQEPYGGVWPCRKRHPLQAAVGRYGAFSSKRRQRRYSTLRIIILSNG